MLKECDDLHIFGVTFDSKMTFERHLCSFSRAASHSLYILRKSCMARISWQNALWEISAFCPASFRVLFWSVVPSCRYIPYLPDRVISGVSFLTEGVLECSIAHSRSVAVLCVLYTIRCNPLHPLHNTLPVPYVPMRATRCAFVTHRSA